MRIADLSAAELRERLRGGELLVDLGPLVLRLEADSALFASAFHSLYASARAPRITEEVADISMQLRRPSTGVYLWLADGRPAGEPKAFPEEMAVAQFEWAIHWAVATALAPSLAFHGSVAVRDDGRGVALIGKSGSGKSTLVAGLVASGWRLGADEYFIVEPTGRVRALPGVMTLKHDAIEIIRGLGSDLIFGPQGTHRDRGTIVHATAKRICGPDDEITIASLVFPTFVAGAGAVLARATVGEALLGLVEQSHNAHVLGKDGFHRVTRLARTPTWAMTFGDLDQALAEVRATVDGTAA